MSPRFASLLAVLALTCAACSDDSCHQQDVGIGFACVPDAAAPDSKITLEVRESCGTYCAEDPVCEAVLRDGTIILTLSQNRCGDVQPISCAAESCTRRIATCDLPELHEGDYPVVIPGSGDLVLHVRPGGQASCHLVDVGP